MYQFDKIYEFVRGPLALSSFIIFFAGIAWQIVMFFSHTKKLEGTRITGPRPTRKEIERYAPSEEIRRLARWEGTVFRMDPCFAILTSIFHIILILTPIFLLAHNILIEQSWGVAPPSFAERFSDILTIVILAFGAFFLYRRLFVPKVRAITTGGDYILFLLVFVPYLTGFLAYHQFFAYKKMIIIHMLTGELMLVCIPFTRLKHMIFYFLNRFFVRGEYNFFKIGNRVWN